MKQDPKALAPADPPAPDAPEDPAFATEAEEDAYWRGVNSGLRMGGESAVTQVGGGGPPAESRRVRRARWDGFTGPKQALFLERIAEGATVEQAAKAAGVSPQAAYNLRNRRAGRAFNLAWEAASRRARRPLADRLHDRALAGQTQTFRDKDQLIVGTRHYHDNRLAMGMLTRLDREAEAYREDERLITAVAEEFEELLDCIEEGGDAEDFILSRTPPPRTYRPQERLPKADEDWVDAYEIRHRYDHVDPADVDTSDLDRAEIPRWTRDQFARAERSGLLERIERDERAEMAARKTGEAADE
ncbi:MAG: hypothetical protein QOD42_2767 [Sphingomonadales bacterium]|jgi:hypothetical protein|nr:hypothetical protein [Sphingomonadales bacterium]